MGFRRAGGPAVDPPALHDETALAVLVFDGQKEDLFETLGQWDRDLTRAARKEVAKLLVAGRVDAGGLRASRSEVEMFVAERRFPGFLETSTTGNWATRKSIRPSSTPSSGTSFPAAPRRCFSSGSRRKSSHSRTKAGC